MPEEGEVAHGVLLVTAKSGEEDGFLQILRDGSNIVVRVGHGAQWRAVYIPVQEWNRLITKVLAHGLLELPDDEAAA